MSESDLRTVLRRVVAFALTGVAVSGYSVYFQATANETAPDIVGQGIVIDGDTIDVAGQRVFQDHVKRITPRRDEICPTRQILRQCHIEDDLIALSNGKRSRMRDRSE